MLEYILCLFYVEFVLVNNFFKILYALVKHMVVGGQMWIH